MDSSRGKRPSKRPRSDSSRMEESAGLKNRIGSLLFSKEFSDVTLVVQGERIPAHKTVLAVSSEYFRALLCGNMKEASQGEVVLEGVSLRGFKQLITYLYTGECNLKELDEDTIFDTLQAVHLYGIKDFQAAICEHLERNMSEDNVYQISDVAQLLQLGKLTDTCHSLLDKIPEIVLEKEDFCDLTANAVSQLLSRDTFCAKEINIFRAVQRWCTTQARSVEDITKVLAAVRLPLIPNAYLATTVRNSGLIPEGQVWEVIKTKRERLKDSKYRGHLLRRRNLALPDHGAKYISKVFDERYVAASDFRSLNIDGFIIFPALRDRVKTSVNIELIKPFLINFLRFRLSGNASYYVEVSLNHQDWARVVDHSEYSCCFLQSLYFEPRVTRFLRIICIEDSAEDVPEISISEVSYTEKRFEVSNGIIVPKNNMASQSRGAAVVEGTNKMNGMLSGLPVKIGKGAGWTSTPFNSYTIMMRFPQPYSIDSIRLYTSYQQAEYSYCIETSVDEITWTRVADCASKKYQSWQILSFEPRPVIFIRITDETAGRNRRLSVAHFECPAQIRTLDACPEL